jgi:TolB-like protein/Tfp pilus assembly protein PilF/predicted Ser/Thr protein kinase
MPVTPGTRLGRYEIVAPLGAGGMGEVYRALDPGLGREVALKVLPTESLDDDAARARLMREAQLAATLNHPNICTIYEVGEAEGLAYIAMERIEGQTLDALTGARGLPPGTVARLGAQIADALDCAHLQGVIHRDLKGANVLVTVDGRVKVLDFGLAKRVQAAGPDDATRSMLTLPGQIVGTPRYLAPEILRGDPADVRSDLWSLGVVLYVMASGAWPFRGVMAELGAAILHEPPEPLPARVPASLAAIIERCLAKDPAQRFRQAGELRTALEGLASDSRLGAGRVTARVHPSLDARRRRRWILAGAGALAVVAAFALGVPAMRKRLPPPHVSGTPSLAVLPLDNFSGDSRQQYFADGMTDELITTLAQSKALRVISRTSVMGFRGSAKPLREIARELGVDAVVEGSVQRSGDRIRITAQLIRAASDEHLWAQSYERDARDVIDLQDEVARAIAAEVQAHLGGSPGPPAGASPRGGRAVSPQAYDLYLRGLAAYRHWEKQSDREAEAWLTRALEVDSTYAPAWAVLGFVYQDEPGQFGTREEDLAHARRVIERALALDPNLGLALAAKARIEYVVDWDWAGAERDFRRAIQLSPSQFEARHEYSHLLMSLGRVAESGDQSRTVLTLDPLDPDAVVHMGWFYYSTGRMDDAIRQFQSAMRLDPTFSEAYRFLSSAYALSGRFGEADAAQRRAIELAGASDTTSALVQLRSRLAMNAVISAKRGRTRDALTIVARMTDSAQPAYDVAAIYALLGRKDEAFRWLDRAITAREEYVVGFRSDPFLASLRGDPRFQAELRRMGLPG